MHEMIHTGEKPYQCRYCAKRFTASEYCTKHEEIHENQPFIVLEDCISKMIKTEEQHHRTESECVVSHVSIKMETEDNNSLFVKTETEAEYTGEEFYQCQYCDRVFSWLEGCVEHEKIHTAEKPNLAFKDNTLEMLLTKEQNQCTESEVVVSHVSEEYDAFFKAKAETEYKCQYCDKVFLMRSTCVEHIERIHTREKPYKCQYCEKRFSMKFWYIKHEKMHTSGGKLYKCRYCDKVFSWLEACVKHEKIHTGELSYKCRYCDKVFSLLEGRVEHEKIHTGEESYTCQYCDKTFSWLEECVEHETIHTGGKHYMCRYCNKRFSIKSWYLKHERIHTSGVRPYKCQYCGKFFSQRNNCEQHERTHTGEKPYQCQYCEKRFTTSDQCKQHEKIHDSIPYITFEDSISKVIKTEEKNQCTESEGVVSHVTTKMESEDYDAFLKTKADTEYTGEESYKCQYCDRVFSWLDGCVEHEKIHTAEKPNLAFKDNILEMLQTKEQNQCTESEGVVPHVSIIMESEDNDAFMKANAETEYTGGKPYKCKYCDKTFRQRARCEEHEITHTPGEKPYTCQYCEKAFSRRDRCVQHEIIHTGEKPYKCQYCEKAFSRRDRCVQHEIIHTGEKPYKCQYCEKAFSRRDTYVQHERIHTGERPYKCQHCEKRFTTSTTCKVHEKIHTRERPYQCQYCEKKFIQKGNCEEHQRIHTGEKPYKCQYCDKAFYTKRHCSVHERIHTEVFNTFGQLSKHEKTHGRKPDIHGAFEDSILRKLNTEEQNQCTESVNALSHVNVKIESEDDDFSGVQTEYLTSACDSSETESGTGHNKMEEDLRGTKLTNDETEHPMPVAMFKNVFNIK